MMQKKIMKEEKYIKARKLLITEMRELLIQRMSLNKRIADIRREMDTWDSYLITK